MNLDFFIQHLEWNAAHAKYFGFLIVFLLMFLESSFLPIPSEIIMIPAGFMAARSEFTFALPYLDLFLLVIIGTIGALCAAYINYYLAKYLGRFFLYKYGKYFFIKPKTIKRAEVEFKKYGDFATFICRLIPAVRQLISIPAGISNMPIWRFTIFTSLGSFIWTLFLAGIGFYFAIVLGNVTYRELINKAEQFIASHTIMFFSVVLLMIAVYIIYKIYKRRKDKKK
jgi:membrane protein DedA with SNARE-associated domain